MSKAVEFSKLLLLNLKSEGFLRHGFSLLGVFDRNISFEGSWDLQIGGKEGDRERADISSVRWVL